MEKKRKNVFFGAKHLQTETQKELIKTKTKKNKTKKTKKMDSPEATKTNTKKNKTNQKKWTHHEVFWFWGSLMSQFSLFFWFWFWG